MTDERGAGLERAAKRHAERVLNASVPVERWHLVHGTPGVALSGPVDPWEFVTEARLLRDTRTLTRSLGPEIDMVMAVARSGLLPGSAIAYERHLPLWTVSRHTGIGNMGHGMRLENRPFAPPKNILIVDDTVASGKEMAACVGIVRAAFPEAAIVRAVVYAHPSAVRAVDVYVSAYDGPHYLEWNWCNAGHGAGCGYDFDGIIVHDDDPAQTPLYLPRRAPVTLIVTGRHESARGLTQSWLDRWGVRCERLVMREFDEPGVYNVFAIASLKARHYDESGLELFAESDPEQAKIIAEITGKAVLCPQMGRVIPATYTNSQRSTGTLNKDTEKADTTRKQRAKACQFRSCETGCKKAICSKYHREVHLTEDCAKWCPETA